MRHRVKIFDLGLVSGGLAAAALFAFEVDVFKNEGQLSQAQQGIELDELFALTTLTVIGVLFYAWRRAREHKRENARRIEAESEVMALAMQDPLTGLPNRRQFTDVLKAALKVVPAEPEAHALLLLDLNGFKKINDVFGHPVGDQALINVGARLMRAVRDGDLVARLGGDEFAIVARNVGGAEGASSVARRVLDAFATPVEIAGSRHAVGVGIGVALAPHDGDEADELLRKADVALYRAKAERVSAIRFFEPGMEARLRERDELERALREAIEANRFALLFQPTARLGGEGVASFEASAKWTHPKLGEIGPERYAPIAEEAGLLSSLMQGLFLRACAEAAGWPRDVRLSFALPGALMLDRTFGLKILAAFAETGLDPKRLDLEIDEGALIRETEAAEAFLPPLRAAGVAVIARNFGTGYSNLKNLQRLSLDGIKIDSSFVAAMEHDRKAAVMVRALINIGRGLDLSVSADGVRDAGQEASLAAQGCDRAQGSLYGGPVDGARAAALAGGEAASANLAI
ncbi:putative bifunctional diguanylate cyclase/phosphodiesterase [Hansschlegelia quercus]|nr:EAL domain-containing protein [Hansschlegelia quercus]